MLALAQSAIRHDLSGMAAQLAFRFMHSTLWFLVFAAAVSGYAASLFDTQNPADRLMETVFSPLEPDMKGVVEGQVRHLVQTRNPMLLVSGGLSSLATGAVAFMAVMKALTSVYGVEDDRSFVSRAALAVGLTLSVGVLLLTAFTAFVLRQVAGDAIVDALGAGEALALVFDLATLAFVIAALVGATAVLYRVTSGTRPRPKWVTIGALLYVAVWLTMTVLVAIYVANFQSYANTYGAVGLLILAFLWFYFSAFALLLGAELNMLLEARREDAPQHAPTPERLASRP